jgi:hypothetical protein
MPERDPGQRREARLLATIGISIGMLLLLRAALAAAGEIGRMDEP